MRVITKRQRNLILLAMLTLPASGSLLAQPQNSPNTDITILGSKTEGPEIKGVISARKGDNIQVTTPDGARTVIVINEATKIKASTGPSAAVPSLARMRCSTAFP